MYLRRKKTLLSGGTSSCFQESDPMGNKRVQRADSLLLTSDVVPEAPGFPSCTNCAACVRLVVQLVPIRARNHSFQVRRNCPNNGELPRFRKIVSCDSLYQKVQWLLTLCLTNFGIKSTINSDMCVFDWDVNCKSSFF